MFKVIPSPSTPMNLLQYMAGKASEALDRRPSTAQALANGQRTIDNPKTYRTRTRFQNLFDNMDWNTKIILDAAPTTYAESAYLDTRRTNA